MRRGNSIDKPFGFSVHRTMHDPHPGMLKVPLLLQTLSGPLEVVNGYCGCRFKAAPDIA